MQRVLALLLAACLLGAAPAVFAHHYKVGTLTIHHPWSRATPKGAVTGVGYMKIVNDGSEPDRLVSIASDMAEKTEVHEMSMDNGVMTMRPLEGGLVIPPKSTVELKSGSLHVMFKGLKGQIIEPIPFEATLTFEKAGPVKVEFMVEAMGASQ